MTICTIRSEVDGYPDLVERLQRIAERVVPVLEEVIQLPVGPDPLIRLVSPDTFVTEVIGEQRRAVHRDVAAFGLDDEEAGVLEQKLAAREEWLNQAWMLTTGYTVDSIDGRPEILMLPKAVHHAALREPILTKTLAMELCHVARHHKSKGVLLHVHESPCPELHGCRPNAYPAFVITGFAEWAAREVTIRLLGDPVLPAPTGEETAEFAQVCGALERRMKEEGITLPGKDTVWLPTRASFPFPPHAAYEDGATWAAFIVERGANGLQLLNHVWAEPELIPTLDEIANPLLWLARARKAVDAEALEVQQ
ncbi:hypothetical protein [Streptomyces longispororuber]|uniref:hypothetical protein n=1 Tax=Streptomyces longispororuber TaxID=68230 RepID=UPI0036FB63D6